MAQSVVQLTGLEVPRLQVYRPAAPGYDVWQAWARWSGYAITRCTRCATRRRFRRGRS